MSETVLWKDLINRAFIENLEGEMANERERVICSHAHYVRMGKIIGVCVGPTRRVKWKRTRLLLAALIAALVFLSGCAMVVYAEDIGRLLFKRFDDGFEMTYAHGAYDGTEQILYLPGVLPRGYVRTDAQDLAGYAEYRAPSGEWFRFEQDRKNNVIYTADTDLKAKGRITVDRASVQYFCVDGLHLYLWESHTDAFRIVSTLPWDEQELSLVIGNLVPADEYAEQ